MGFVHYFGGLGRVDYESAALFLRKAAESGSAWAQYAMGFMHETGKGVAKDVEAAMDAGFDLHIAKPVDFDTFVPLVLRLATGAKVRGTGSLA